MSNMQTIADDCRVRAGGLGTPHAERKGLVRRWRCTKVDSDNVGGNVGDGDDSIIVACYVSASEGTTEYVTEERRGIR